MDNQKTGLWGRFWMAVPKTPTQLLVFWLFIHAMIGTKYLIQGHPYKDREFSIKDVAQGHYMGFPATICYSLALWGLILFLCLYVVVWLS